MRAFLKVKILNKKYFVKNESIYLCPKFETLHLLSFTLVYDHFQLIMAKRVFHNEKLNDLFSPNTVRVIKSGRMKWKGHVACMGERRGVYRVLVGKPGGESPFGRPRRRGEDNIKMDLQKGGCGGCGLDRAGIGAGSGHL
jgi:hypothetical protein